MAIRYCVLASGSKGNAIWIEAAGRAILVDSGLSAREIKRRLALVGLDPSRLEAILVSHEHRDHVSGVGVLARNLGLSIYAGPATLKQVLNFWGRVETNSFNSSVPFTIGGLTIQPFSLSHDAVDPVGFIFEHEGLRLGLATDLGVTTNLVRQRLSGCHGLIMEANHDYQMLMAGPYPWELKQRVRGRQGHLSNDDAAELLAALAHQDLKNVTLAHLSETNNLPHLALSKVSTAVSQPSFTLTAAGQHQPGPIIEI